MNQEFKEIYKITKMDTQGVENERSQNIVINITEKKPYKQKIKNTLKLFENFKVLKICNEILKLIKRIGKPGEFYNNFINQIYTQKTILKVINEIMKEILTNILLYT